MLDSLVNKEDQTNKMLRAFLLQVMSDSKETYETCQIMMLAKNDGKAYFLASNSKGYVMDEDTGKVKVFSVRDIAGMMTYMAFGSVIEDFLSELIDRAKEFFKLENNEVIMQVFGTDASCNNLAYFINDKEKLQVQIEFSEDKYIERIEQEKIERDPSLFFIFTKNDDDEEIETKEEQ